MYKVEITNKGTSLFKVKSQEQEFTIDTKGQGITPPDALLASLGSCIGVYLRKYFEGVKITSSGFKITVESNFLKEAPVCFKEIRVSIDLEGTQIDPRRKIALLKFIKNCPVHNTLEAKPVINIGLV